MTENASYDWKRRKTKEYSGCKSTLLHVYPTYPTDVNHVCEVSESEICAGVAVVIVSGSAIFCPEENGSFLEGTYCVCWRV